MKPALRSAQRLLRETATEFVADDCPRMAAALSFYTILSLPPLVVLLLTVAGAVLEPETVEGLVTGQLAGFVGPAAMRQVQAILRNTQALGGGGLLPTLLSAGTVLFGATGAFAQLQTSLNRAWEIIPDPAYGGVRTFVSKRFVSFLMVLGVGVLLLASVLLSAAVSAFGGVAASALPGDASTAALRVLNTSVSVVVITLLFAALFRVLPDAAIHWRDVAVGATATALLFVAGKTAFGVYLARSEPGSAYGAAGSLAVLLLWIYVASMVLLLGAEFTQVWARNHGTRIVPLPGAVCLRGEREPAAAAGLRSRIRRWRSAR